MCELLGAKVVFVDLRDVFLQQLYIPPAAKSDVRLLLQRLNVALGAIPRRLPRPPPATTDGPRPLRLQAISAIFGACVEAYEMVLLHGGARRVFEVADAQVRAPHCQRQ